MSRTRRMSRWLIAMTAVVLAMGLIFWVSKLHRSPQTAHAAPTSRPASAAHLATTATQPVGAAVAASASVTPAVPATQPAPAAPQTLVMTTPGFGSGPATRPAAPMLAAVMETSPAQHAAIAAPDVKEKSQPGAPAASPAANTVSTQPLVDAKTQIDANQLLAARRILNTAMSGGKLSEQDTAAAKQMLNSINAKVVFSNEHFPTDEYGGQYTVQKNDRLAKIAANHEITWELLSRINNNLKPERLREGQSIKVLKGPVNAVVNKKNFTMELWLGNPGESGAVYITSFPVGLGKDDSTPPGTWMVEPGKKVKNPTYFSPRGEGRIEADDPKNPLGEYWIGLAGIDGAAVGKKSYGIHGTIDPGSIGKMASMGCIRMKNEDVGLVFELLVEGKSTVVVKD